MNWEGKDLLDEGNHAYKVLNRARTVASHLATYVGYLDKGGNEEEPSGILGYWDGVLRLLIGARLEPGEMYSHIFESRHIRVEEKSLAADVARDCDGLRGQELIDRLFPLLDGYADRILAAMRTDESPCYYYELNGRVVYEDPRGGRTVDPLRGEDDPTASWRMMDLQFKGEGDLEFLSFAEARARLEREGADIGSLFFRADDAASAFMAREEFNRLHGIEDVAADAVAGNGEHLTGSEEDMAMMRKDLKDKRKDPDPSAGGRREGFLCRGMFQLEDITEELLARVVYYHFGHPSPHIDTAGFIEFLTEDGQLYTIDCGRRGDGFEFPYRNWHEVFPVINETGACGRWAFSDDERRKVFGSPSTGDHYVVGEWGVAYFGGDHLVRREHYPAFLAELERRGRACCREAAAAALGFDPDECLANRLMYAKSIEALDREEREREAWAEHWRRVRLEPRDLDWAEWRRGGAPDPATGFRGCRTVLYKENSDGSLFAVMWTIKAQLDTDMFDGPESRPDLFNVYHRRWYKVKGEVRVSTQHGGEPSDMGDFVRTCRTLDEAKELAMRRNDEGLGWGGFSRENLVDPVTRQLVFGGDVPGKRR